MPVHRTLLPRPRDESESEKSSTNCLFLSPEPEMSLLDIENKMPSIMEELDALSERMGMPVTQENGQRRFGPPRDCKTVPPKGCEVFVGKIPRDCFEPELVPVFEKVGRIYELRLMMDFSGTNRGYCFVQYFLPANAKAACDELNKFEIRKGRAIGVVKSVDNCRLFIGGIPKDKTETDIFSEVSRITEGVVRVIVYPSVMDKSKNRGFAFIEYENHKAAAMARRKMIPGKTPMWGQTMCVDWAEPEPDVDSEIMNKVQVLYVRNLMISTTEELLSETFNSVSNNGVERVKKMKDYAFIHFHSREQAESAKQAMNGTEIDGSCVEICWSKPVEKDAYKARKAISRSLYSQGGRSINGSVSNPQLPYMNNHGTLNGSDMPFQGYHSMAQPSFMNQMEYFQYITQQMQLIPAAAFRNNRNRNNNRVRAAAGVQGMRIPTMASGRLQSHPQEAAYKIIPYASAVIPDQMYYPPYQPIVAANGTQHLYGAQTPGTSIPNLVDVRGRYGWGEAVYDTAPMNNEDENDYYQCAVVVPHYSNGLKEY